MKTSKIDLISKAMEESWRVKSPTGRKAAGAFSKWSKRLLPHRFCGCSAWDQLFGHHDRANGIADFAANVGLLTMYGVFLRWGYPLDTCRVLVWRFCSCDVGIAFDWFDGAASTLTRKR